MNIKIDDNIRDEKLQYDINREAAKISALSSSKIDTYEYLTGEEILPPDQSRIIEHPEFTYFPLGKALEEKNNWRTRKKQIEALEILEPQENQKLKSIEGPFPKKMATNEIKKRGTWN